MFSGRRSRERKEREMKETVTLWDGAVLTGYREDDIFGRIAGRRRYFEERILQAWLPWAEPASCIADIGANLGNHTVFWGRHTRASMIYAWEPYGENVRLLEENCAANGLSQVTVCPFAAAGTNGEVYLSGPVDRTSLGNAAYTRERGGDAGVFGDDGAAVRAVCLDDFFREKETPDFVKIDAEGMALEILKGAEDCLARAHPTIWAECEAENCLAVLAALENRGYRLIDVAGFNFLFSHPDRRPADVPFDYKQLLPRYLDARRQMLEAECACHEKKDSEP